MPVVSNKASNRNTSASNNSDVLLSVHALKKVYRSGAAELVLFENLSFTVEPGELLAIVGESGSGKSSLLHLLGALDSPSAGEVSFRGQAVNGMSEAEAAEMRNRYIGYVWQFHYLLPEFSALENIAMPLLARGESPENAYAQAGEWIEHVGLSQRATHRPGELSGGEQQRVALARALVTRPLLLLADEPTGDLDNRTSEAIFELICQLHTGMAVSGHKLTSLIVTHNLEFARRCDRVLRLKEGKVEEISPNALA
jgi:lipoprotein-releasing system ATP-binding protein